MTPIDLFLFGMPAVLAIGGAVTVYFAKRAAADIRTRAGLKPPPIRRTFRTIATRRTSSTSGAVSDKSRTLVH